jgi:hypothetical protein
LKSKQKASAFALLCKRAKVGQVQFETLILTVTPRSENVHQIFYVRPSNAGNECGIDQILFVGLSFCSVFGEKCRGVTGIVTTIATILPFRPVLKVHKTYFETVDTLGFVSHSHFL